MSLSKTPSKSKKWVLYQSPHRKLRYLGTFDVDADGDVDVDSPSQVKNTEDFTNDESTTSVNNRFKQEIQKEKESIGFSGFNAFNKSQVEAENDPLFETSLSGQRRKRTSFLKMTNRAEDSDEDLPTPSIKKHVKRSSSLFAHEKRAGSHPVELNIMPHIGENKSTTASVQLQNDPKTNGFASSASHRVLDDANDSPASARSQTVEAARPNLIEANDLPAKSPTVHEAQGEIPNAGANARPQPSKFAKTVMHAFDINHQAFNDAGLCRRLRLYKRALTAGDKQEASTRYKDFFVYPWESVGTSNVDFDLATLIAGICAYQEMAMTDITVSHGITEIKTDMANGDHDGVKDRACLLYTSPSPRD